MPEREGHNGHDTDQESQSYLIIDTGNGPTEPDEGSLLRELFGPPLDGIYGGVLYGNS